MKHIRKFESYRNLKKRQEIIKESVLQVDDIYKVRTMVDIPQSLINAYVKKVKEVTGKNLRQYFGDVDIAEEIVKYITMSQMDSEKIPANALMGGQAQAQVQTQTEEETQAETQDEETKEEDDFEEVQTQEETQEETETQSQAQPQAQTQGQDQPQGQAQTQSQAQPQGQAQTQELPEE